jgi:type II secretory ATPase GspE/PulE/Tfp pilus assembly ATPase PilB-like protein
MQDINCKCCGEPYSAYALRNDVAQWEDQPDDAYEKFMSGEGCPTCDWGEKEGEVSLSQSESKEETQQRFLESMVSGTDEDPIEYLEPDW